MPEATEWVAATDALPELGWTEGDTCPDCGSTRWRSPRWDLMACPVCDTTGLPARVADRITSAPTDVARNGPSREEQRQLTALKASRLEALGHRRLLAWLDPDEWGTDDRPNVAGARAYFAELGDEIAAARDTAEVAELSSTYTENLNSSIVQCLLTSRQAAEQWPEDYGQMPAITNEYDDDDGGDYWLIAFEGVPGVGVSVAG